MANRSPSVVTGARGPRDTRPPKAVSDPARGAAGIPEGEVWYQGRYSRLRIQLTAPQDEHLPDGRVRTHRPIVAQFEQSFLKLKLSKERHKRTHELLQEHEKFGQLFWDFQDALEQKAEQEREQATAVLRDPAQKAIILKALQAEGIDFDLPKAGGTGRKAKSKSEDGETSD